MLDIFISCFYSFVVPQRGIIWHKITYIYHSGKGSAFSLGSNKLNDLQLLVLLCNSYAWPWSYCLENEELEMESIQETRVTQNTDLRANKQSKWEQTPKWGKGDSSSRSSLRNPLMKHTGMQEELEDTWKWFGREIHLGLSHNNNNNNGSDIPLS